MDISGMGDMSVLMDDLRSQPIPKDMSSAVDLLFILRKSGVPLSCFGKIREWVHSNHDVDLPTRDGVFKYFTRRYDLEDLWPRSKACYLPGQERKVPLVYHSAEAAIRSLLSNPVLMQPENLNIDLDDPHKAPEITPYIHDVTSGTVYQMGWKEYCHDSPKKVPCFVIPFIDSSPLDIHGNIQLFPVPFTLSIFKESVRRRPEAWATLFYVRNRETLVVESELGVEGLEGGEAFTATAQMNKRTQDFHSMLKTGFEELDSIQRNGGLLWQPPDSPDGSKRLEYLLQVPILCIMGDAEGNDKCCCLKGGSIGNNPQCRYCECPYDKMGDPYADYRLTTMARIKRFCETDPGQAEKRGYWPFSRNVFFSLPFCDQEGGVHACTPAGILHQQQKGVLEYACYGFYDLTQAPPKQQRLFTTESIKVADRKMRQIGFHLQ